MQTGLQTTANHDNLISLLSKTVYEGAPIDHISTIVSYCDALKIDPLLKPFHVVKFSDSHQIMPSIEFYRIRAHRVGCNGISAPTFGPTITEKFTYTKKDWDTKKTTQEEVNISYPEWALVTVKRLRPNGMVGEFQGKVFWKEKYGTDKYGKITKFWIKSPFEQLAKCAEMQALKKAFPEIIPPELTIETNKPEDFADYPKPQITNVTPNDAAVSIDDAKEKAIVRLNECKTLADLQKVFRDIWREPMTRFFEADILLTKDLCKEFLISEGKKEKPDEWLEEFDNTPSTTTGEINERTVA